MGYSTMRLLSLLVLLLTSPAWATFPVDETVNHGTDVGSDTSTVITLPTSIASGDLVVCYIYGSGGNGTWSSTGPDDIWNEFATQTGEGNMEWGWHEGTGSEAATTTVVTNSATAGTFGCWRFSGAVDPDTTPPEAAGAQVDGTNAPDPPSITPSWGCDDTFFIAAAGVRGGPGEFDGGYPTNYSNGGTQDGGLPASAYADREVQASPEDPSAFSLGNTNNWLAMTIAIPPSVSGTCSSGGVPVQRRRHTQ